MSDPRERLAHWNVVDFIEKLAARSEALSVQAGVGGAETAGHLISYFDDYPEDIEPFLNGGFLELPDDWIVRGSLSYHARNGKIVRPEFARQSVVIKKLKRGEFSHE